MSDTYEEEDHDSPVRLLAGVSRNHAADVLLTTYFLGACLASGIAGLTQLSDDGALGTLISGNVGSAVALTYAWGMTLLGICGVVARILDSRRAELWVIWGVAGFTVINAVILLPEHVATALRLGFAPAMMLPYAYLRLGFNVTPAKVGQIQQAIIRRNGRSRAGDDGDRTGDQ